MKRRQIPFLIASALLGCALAAGVPAAERQEVGRAFFEYEGAKGVLDPAAVTIESGSIFRAVSSPAVLHFDNGEVLRFAANTAALFEDIADGRVRVRVLSGQVSKLDERDRVLSAGSGSVFTLEPSSRDPLEVEATLLRLAAAADGPGSGRAIERAADRPRR